MTLSNSGQERPLPIVAGVQWGDTSARMLLAALAFVFAGPAHPEMRNTESIQSIHHLHANSNPGRAVTGFSELTVASGVSAPTLHLTTVDKLDALHAPASVSSTALATQSLQSHASAQALGTLSSSASPSRPLAGSETTQVARVVNNGTHTKLSAQVLARVYDTESTTTTQSTTQLNTRYKISEAINAKIGTSRVAGLHAPSNFGAPARNAVHTSNAAASGNRVQSRHHVSTNEYRAAATMTHYAVQATSANSKAGNQRHVSTFHQADAYGVSRPGISALLHRSGQHIGSSTALRQHNLKESAYSQTGLTSLAPSTRMFPARTDSVRSVHQRSNSR